MAVEVERSHQHSITFCCHASDGRRGVVRKMSMKQKCGIEFKKKKIAPTDIHWCSLNIYGDQTMDGSVVWWQVVHFSSGDSDVKDNPCSRQPHTAVTSWNDECLHQLVHRHWLMMMTTLKNSVCSWEFPLSNSAIEIYWASCSCCSFHGNKQEA